MTIGRLFLSHRATLRYRMDTQLVSRVQSEGSELEDFIPYEVQDAYHFIDTVFQVRNAVFQVPRCITLNRYRYLLSEIGRAHEIESIFVLDPLSNSTPEQQKVGIEVMDKGAYDALSNLLVLCVSGTAQSILNLPVDSSTSVVPFHDIQVSGMTLFGLFTLVFRVLTPVSVTCNASREFYLRQIASNNPALSVRSMLLVTDPLFPLHLIPGVGNYTTLLHIADHESVLQ